MGGAELDMLVRTCSASVKEYISGLRQAVPGGVTVDGNSITVESGPVTIEIGLKTLPDYVIASMHLPSLKATWRFKSGTYQEREDCLKRIDWSMKRGGG